MFLDQPRGRLSRFLSREDGASTVQWVILTASGMAMALAGLSLISGGVENLARDLPDTLEEAGHSDRFPGDPPAGG